MRVKCPKCRLVFDVLADAGMTEVQCNCPRCGTPFAHNAACDADGVDTKGQVPGTQVMGHDASADTPVAAATVEGKVEGSQPVAGNAVRDGRGAMPGQSAVQGNSLYEHRHGNDGFAPHGRGGTGRFATLVAGVAATLVVAVLIAVGADRLMGHFTEHDEALMEQLAVVPDSTMADSVEAVGGKDARTASIAVATKGNGGKKRKGKDAETADGGIPTWVCGVWHAMSDNNYVTVRIGGGKIKVSDFYHTGTGRVTLSGNTLVCRFSDGSTSTYALDRDNHRIVGSDGMVLEK